jgi:hypothetical protein
LQESSTSGEIDGRFSAAGADDGALTTWTPEDGAARGSEELTSEGASDVVATGKNDEHNACARCESSVCDTGGIGFAFVKEKGKELIGGSFALVESCSMGFV